MIRHQFYRACYHIFMVLPYSMHGSRIANWLLPYAGLHAYCGQDDACLCNECWEAINRSRK